MSETGNSADAALERRQQLTEQIRAFAAAAADKSALYPVKAANAAACGRALAELKPLLPHGEWGVWLKEQCGLTRMTASRYMRLGRSFDASSRLICIRGGYMACGISKPRSGEKPGPYLFPS